MGNVWYPQCRVILSVVFDGFGGGDSHPTIVNVIPKEATVNLTGYKEADTWSMTFDAKALPFSPDIIRAIGVEVYMFDAKGTSNEGVGEMANDDNLLIAGLADNASLEAGSSGRVFTCDGRDYTALLLDKHWDPRVRVPTGQLISKVVQDVVDVAVQAETHGGRTITVEYQATDPEPVVGQYRSKTNKKGKPVKSGENAWDVIYKMCLAEGLVCFVRGFKLIITNPQTLTLQSARKARRVAYGRNLSTLKIDRKLGKEKTPQIEVTSYSSTARGTISARFPEGKDAVSTGIGTKTEDRQFFVIDGVNDVTALKRIAESMYNNLARGEAKVMFTTKSLTDLTEGPSDNAQLTHEAVRGGGTGPSQAALESAQDLLQLRAGDPVVIGFDPFKSDIMEKLRGDERYEVLRQLGYSQSVAGLVAREYERIDQFRRPFYVRNVEVSWSIKDGITLEVEAVNFVSTARDDRSAQILVDSIQDGLTSLALGVKGLLGGGS